MPTHTTILLPYKLVRRAERLAQKYNIPLAELFNSALMVAEKERWDEKVDILNYQQLSIREAAYRAIYPRLIKTTVTHFVAIQDEELVDFDLDEQALLDRIVRDDPTRVVCIKHITPTTQTDLPVRPPN